MDNDNNVVSKLPDNSGEFKYELIEKPDGEFIVEDKNKIQVMSGLDESLYDFKLEVEAPLTFEKLKDWNEPEQEEEEEEEDDDMSLYNMSLDNMSLDNMSLDDI